MRGLIALLLILLSSPAAADDRYAVVAMEISGDADPNLRAQVQAGLARGVEEVGGAVIGYDEVQKRLAGKPALVGCLSTTCLASIAEVVGTNQMIRMRIAANGANYEVELELLGPEGPVRRRAGSCTVCTVSDLADLTATRVNELLSASGPAVLRVEITTEPADATLEIPGVGSQPAPWAGELAPGTYEVEAHKAGFRRARQEIAVVDDGTEQRFAIPLVAELGAPGERPRRAPWIKWATAGTAAAALVTGVVLLSMNGDPTCSVPDATCPEQYATGAPGALFTIAGVAGAGAAGYFFYTEWKF